MIAKEFNPNVSKSYYLTRHLLLDAIKRNSGYIKGNKLLDIGCASKPYKSLFHFDEYIGLDYLSEGHNHNNSVVDYWYDGNKFPFENDSFENAFSSETFEHIFNPEEHLKEVNRVLEDGAFFMLTTCYIIAEHEQPIHFANYTSFGLISLFQRNGFRLVHYEKIGTSIQAQFQMFMSYLDSYVICKFKKLKLYKPVAAITFTFLNLTCMLFNWLLPKKYDAFLGHIIIVKK